MNGEIMSSTRRRAFGEGRPFLSTTIEGKSRSVDHRGVKGFGERRSRFGNRQLEVDELEIMFSHYTVVFSWEDLSEDAEGFDSSSIDTGRSM